MIGQMNFSEDTCNSILEYYELFKNDKPEAITAFDELYTLGVVSNVDKASRKISLFLDRLNALGFVLTYNMYTDYISFVRIVDLPYLYNVIPFLGDTITPNVFSSYSLLKFKCEFTSPK